MKKYILLLSLFISFSCEDNDDKDAEGSELVGLWKMTNVGEYANANCTGDIDNSAFALMAAFGFEATMEFKTGGTGTYKVSALGDVQQLPLTWDGSKSELCLAGMDCYQYRLEGNKFNFDEKYEAYCENMQTGEELDQYGDKTSCNNSGNYWNEATCNTNEFTKQ